MSTKEAKAKKEFSKWSKAQLVKKCKKLKIPTVGSKWDLIDRILNHNKKKIKNSKKKQTIDSLNKTRNTFNTSSGSDATKLILNAYIHQIRISIGIVNIENKLIEIISFYLGPTILMRLDICPYNYIKKEILNYGKKIHRGKHNTEWLDGDSDTRQHQNGVIYGSSLGFKYGIHSWKIKIDGKIYHNYEFDNEFDLIGIGANIKINENNGCVVQSEEAYFIQGGEKIIKSCSIPFGMPTKRMDKIRIAQSNYNYVIRTWQPKDVIKIILNCDKGMVIFKVNNKKIGKAINIVKDKTYYPLIYSQNDFCKFTLVYTTH